MILTDYYKFEKVAMLSKTRIDCTASTESYPELEQSRITKGKKASTWHDEIKVGALIGYIVGTDTYMRSGRRRKADKALTIKGKNFSSIFIPDVTNCKYGYGDVQGTNDALLFVLEGIKFVNGQIQGGGTIEMFIARGRSGQAINLYQSLENGELDNELETLRAQAKALAVDEGVSY